MITSKYKSKDTITNLRAERDFLEIECKKYGLELKRERARLKETERLATLGKLASVVAHELRNPMGVIRLAVYSLEKKIDLKDKNLHKHLENIDKKVIECDQIIHDLLAFSRASELEFFEVSLNASVKEALQEAKHYIKESNVKITKDFDKNTLNTIADFSQLTEVFYNLFINAIQAMEESKEKELKVVTKRNNNFAEIEISDTGYGIAKENLKKLGEPFFSTKTKGIGLGLYITYEIIHRHKGTISVESKVNKGTTFLISLPLEE